MKPSEIKKATLDDQKELVSLLRRLQKLAGDFTSRIEHGDISFTYHGDLFERVNTQLDVIESALELCLTGRYRAAFICVRSVFEHYFAIRLASEASRYALRWKRSKGDSLQAALQKAQTFVVDTRAAGRKDVLRAAKFGDEIYIVIDGPYTNNERKKANRISYYQMVFEEYDPDRSYLPAEMLRTPWITGRAEVREQAQRISESIRHHREIRQQFMSWERLQFHSKVNRFLSKRQEQRVRVHYNFLSHFVHPSMIAIESLREDNTPDSYIRYVLDLRHYDFHVCHLLLLYISFFFLMYLEIQARIVKRASRSYFRGLKSEQAVADCCVELLERYGYFWFIYHGRPVEIVKFNQLVPLLQTGRLPEGYGVQDLPDEKVKYYSNPLVHLYSLSESWRNKILGSVRGPLADHPRPLWR